MIRTDDPPDSAVSVSVTRLVLAPAENRLASAALAAGAERNKFAFPLGGSLHTVQIGRDRAEPVTLYRLWEPEDVISAYLDEVPKMIACSEVFEVFTHIDYAARHWPTAEAGPFDPKQFEDGFRSAMRAIADSGRALEMNTRRLWPWMPQWWKEEGGRAVSFGSDAHVPQALADGFPEAVCMLEQIGFHPGNRSQDLWTS